MRLILNINQMILPQNLGLHADGSHLMIQYQPSIDSLQLSLIQIQEKLPKFAIPLKPLNTLNLDISYLSSVSNGLT